MILLSLKHIFPHISRGEGATEQRMGKINLSNTGRDRMNEYMKGLEIYVPDSDGPMTLFAET